MKTAFQDYSPLFRVDSPPHVRWEAKISRFFGRFKKIYLSFVLGVATLSIEIRAGVGEPAAAPSRNPPSEGRGLDRPCYVPTVDNRVGCSGPNRLCAVGAFFMGVFGGISRQTGGIYAQKETVALSLSPPGDGLTGQRNDAISEVSASLARCSTEGMVAGLSPYPLRIPVSKNVTEIGPATQDFFGRFPKKS